ncbi:MAG: macro domain-containing protein [Oligoflexia bacterium]|nr:macro domain-containing protein [Oligoflexia bacterium]
MIQDVSGDILFTKAQVLAHGVGVNDDFKSELAMALRQQWPALYKDFRHYCQSTHPKPGGVWVWQGTDGRRIVNLFTQEPPSAKGQHPGPAHLEFVNRSLHDLAQYLREEKIQSVALPRLATGVGRLDWKDVLPLIKKHLGEVDCTVYVYSTYHKGKKAEEK